MNASQLYVGEEYAYHPRPPKGRIPIDAVKVTLSSAEQRKRPFDTNRHTVATVVFADSGAERTVRARDLIMFWDEYESEQRHMLQERAEREKARRRRELKKTIIEQILSFKLAERGIPLTFTVSWDETTAYTTVPQLRSWLEITEEQIEAAIDKVMEKEYGEEEKGRGEVAG